MSNGLDVPPLPTRGSNRRTGSMLLLNRYRHRFAPTTSNTEVQLPMLNSASGRRFLRLYLVRVMSNRRRRQGGMAARS